MNDILLALLPGNPEQDKVMRNLDLSYMSKDKYGEVSVIKQGEELPELFLTGVDKIHILAHGKTGEIAGLSGDKFAEKLIKSFRQKNLNGKKIILYSCEAANGGKDSVMQKMIEKFVGTGITNFWLIAATGETFTMSTGAVRVLDNQYTPNQLSNQVENKKGDARDNAAEQYLQKFGKGWKGIRVQENTKTRDLEEAEIRGYLVEGKP